MYQELGERISIYKTSYTFRVKGNLRVKEQNNYVTFSFDVPTIV
ncbi:hypothetical protein OTSGILL_1133 [Orientia tsutsugamushi str. Gilliam]|uniref:Uncharacterized protein n=1 Tax=Orientia tsutsugamushi str. Gilliam TaxID=1359184 RepID=A0A0F3MB60_ORITS|nr:hypothetical protein [Orientia tsutsugamushi]KJV52995.1 hypothetical protein OTSGILL_1133 [Orientia tsutsugamushi str. Gilliam]